MDKQAANRPFPLPSEIATVPGTEGWEDMYPYYTRMQPADDDVFWFCNSMHFPEPMPAFDAITAEIPYTAMGANTTRVFAFPATLGVEYRIINGRVYITAHAVTDPGEIARRTEVFNKRAGHYFENWDELYGRWRNKMLALIEEIDRIEVPQLPELDDETTVLEARGIAQNHFVRERFHRCIDLFSVMWHHHFEFLMLGYGAYLVFFEFCKKAFPEMTDQTVARMVSGIDILMFQADDKLKSLAQLAVDLDLDGFFGDGADPDVVLDSIRAAGDAGEKWLAAFDEIRYPWFNLSVGDGFYHYHRSWDDDRTVPFSAISHFINRIRSGDDIVRKTEELRAERQRISDEYRALLETEEEKGAFDQMLGLCHRVFPYVEDHKFYCEHWFTTRFYAKMRGFGALLVKCNILKDIEDLFQLRHSEVEAALVDAMLAWAAGSKPVGAQHWQPVIERRREILAKLAEWEAPVAVGPMPEHLEDPAVHMLWGITSDTLKAWSRAPETADENEIRGFAASPGIVEGIARVLRNVNEIGQVREGDILVSPVTTPSWGPVFPKIKAAVSDIGGTMSHAAIVAREYGMPAVVGTGRATYRIRTGQRVRVDGDRGVVTLLD
ncbi:MAG TPA: PEP-utilizing enzyme [Woeseiaceae bacterium]|nr:PEP-utilizing enzyme [Woeseiaceae bacterium]